MTAPPDTLRAFVAVELPEGAQIGLARLQEALRWGPRQAGAWRWVDPGGVHLTLKFLGGIPKGQAPFIAEALERVVEGRGPFTLRFGELGAFPSLARPRVLWMSLEGDLPTLLSLQRDVEGCLAPLAFPHEGRAFSPHLTLARARPGCRVDGQALIEGVRPQDYLAEAVIPVDGLVLMQSTLRPQGALYTPLWRGRLGSMTSLPSGHCKADLKPQ